MIECEISLEHVAEKRSSGQKLRTIQNAVHLAFENSRSNQ